MSEETLEEAAYQARRDYQDEVGKDGMNECIMFDAMKIQKGFELGAKWQAERMYTKENILDFAEYCLSHADAFNTPKDDLFTKWIEQIKKK